MLTLLFFVIWFINIFLSFQKKNIKSIIVLSIIFLIILFGGNTLNRDYLNYKTVYDLGDLSIYDIGYQLIGNLCIKLKMSYNSFLLVLIIPCYASVFYVAYKMKTNFHVFFGLYLTFLVFYDITQVRNFIVVALLTLGTYFIYQKRYIPFIVIIIIASFFHSIALFYLPMIIIDKIPKTKKLYKHLAIYALSTIFVLKLIVSNSDIIGRIIQLFSNNEEVIIYGTSNINFGFLVPITYFAFNILLITYSRKILISIGKHDENSRFIEVCINTLILSMIFVPLLTVNLTFDRVFRNFSLLYYILAGVIMNELLNNREKNKKYITSFFGFLVIFSLVWTLGTIFRYNGFNEAEYEMILNNNMFIN